MSQILLYSAYSEIFSHFVLMITITVAEMCSFDPCPNITVLVIYLPHLTHFDGGGGALYCPGHGILKTNDRADRLANNGRTDRLANKW